MLEFVCVPDLRLRSLPFLSSFPFFLLSFCGFVALLLASLFCVYFASLSFFLFSFHSPPRLLTSSKLALRFADTNKTITLSPHTLTKSLPLSLPHTPSVPSNHPQKNPPTPPFTTPQKPQKTMQLPLTLLLGAAALAPISTASPLLTARQSNLQNFETGLGDILAPAVLSSADRRRPFVVDGNTFVLLTEARARSCDLQVNLCSDFVNGARGGAGFTVQQCAGQRGMFVPFSFVLGEGLGGVGGWLC